MATHQTDFREYVRGRLPGDMTERWTTGQQSVVAGALCDLAHRNALLIQGKASSTARQALSWNAPDLDTGKANQELLVRIRLLRRATTDLRVLVLRGGGAAGTEAGYTVSFDFSASNVLRVNKYVAGTNTSLAASGAQTFALHTFYFLRFRANGTTVQARYWLEGDSEPGGWHATATDSALTDGWMGTHVADDDDAFEVDYLGVATNGGTAPAESTLPRSLDVWSLDPAVELEFTLEATHFNPATGLVEVDWKSSRGRSTGAADWPPDKDMDNVLIEPGAVSQRLEADALFGAQVSEALQQIRLKNTPASAGGLGPLSHWLDRSFAGHPQVIRVGEWGAANHRAFDVLYAAPANGEPVVTTQEVSLPIGAIQAEPGATVAGATLPLAMEEMLEARRHIGIPTGVKFLTSSGTWSAPSNAAYNVLSFTLGLRFRGSTNFGTTSFGNLMRREVSGTNRQFQVALYHASAGGGLAGKIQINVSCGGVSKLIVQSLATYLDDTVHTLVFGLSDQAEAYVMVDDEVIGTVDSSTLTAAVDLPAQPITCATAGNSMANGLALDWRFYNRFLTPDEAREKFAQRVDGTDPHLVGSWRGDDASGATITDYSATANHATLAGTINTDWRWEPTDLGSPEQAGTPMPLSLGVMFNALAQRIDGARDRYRVHDRTLSIGGLDLRDEVVKAQGLAITGGGTDYTDVGGGVYDMVAAVAQPITYDLGVGASPEPTPLHVPILVRDQLIERARYSVATLDREAFDALRVQLPYLGGAAYAEPPQVGAFLEQFLGRIGAHHRRDRSGRLAPGVLTPTANPGPYGHDQLLEFVASTSRGVVWSSVSGYNLTQGSGGVQHFGVIALIKFHRPPGDGSMAGPLTFFPAGMTLVDKGSAAGKGYYLGIDGGTGDLVFGAPGVTNTTDALHYTTLSHAWVPGRWYVVGGQQNNNQRFAMIRPIVSGASVLSNMTATSGVIQAATGSPVLVGHGPHGSFAGVLSYVIGSSPGHDGASLSALAQARRTLNDGSLGGTSRFWAELRDGEGEFALEQVETRSGRIGGARWCPRATLDFTIPQAAEFGGLHRLRPAWAARARYRINHNPMQGADVVGTTPEEEIDLAQHNRSADLADSSTRDNYLQAREIVLDTVLASEDAAAAVAADMRYRFDPEGRRGGDIRDWTAELLRLQLTDEVLVKHPDFGLSGGLPFRVVSLAYKLGLLSSGTIGGDLGIWR